MTKVIADISMSLDGFVTGPDPDLDHGLGHGGEPIHDWVMEADDIDNKILKDSTERSGSVVMGRNLFDIIDGPQGWSDEMGYGAGNVGKPSFFVVSHSKPDVIRLSTLDFTFVNGLAEAIERARAAAGDKDVFVMGGGDVIRQAVDAGLADELRIHLSPIVLGEGTPLFEGIGRHELVQREVQVSANATHLVYEVRRS
ncbi:MAG: dihydrofolate reductase family protein [Actinomycetota bacterium]